GSTTGVMSVGCFEFTLPASDLPGGAFPCIELEMTCPASGYTAANIKPSFIFMNTTGDTRGVFEDNGAMWQFGTGFTAATGNIVGAGYSTLRIGFGDQLDTLRYLPLSTAEASFTSAYPVALTYGGTALNITSSVSSADNIAEILATSTATSGTVKALWVTMTANGSGSQTARGISVTQTVTLPLAYSYPIYVYSATVSNHAITQYAGIFLYLEDMGNAVQHQAGVSINRNITNVGTSSDCFLQMRNHGGTTATAFIKCTGAATHLFDFQDGDLSVPLSEYSSGTTV
ncbi:unnamed protein product, partial [marine sediment metagenome]